MFRTVDALVREGQSGGEVRFPSGHHVVDAQGKLLEDELVGVFPFADVEAGCFVVGHPFVLPAEEVVVVFARRVVEGDAVGVDIVVAPVDGERTLAFGLYAFHPDGPWHGVGAGDFAAVEVRFDAHLVAGLRLDVRGVAVPCHVVGHGAHVAPSDVEVHVEVRHIGAALVDVGKEVGACGHGADGGVGVDHGVDDEQLAPLVVAVVVERDVAVARHGQRHRCSRDDEHADVRCPVFEDMLWIGKDCHNQNSRL